MYALNSHRVCIALLLISISLVYANALGASFQFDDFNVIVNYSSVHSLRGWFDALPGIRPLLKLSYATNWVIDHRPFGFHVFNVICHLLSAWLVFFLARDLFRDSANRNAVSLIAALLFALHPAQTEAVTYISGRSVALMSLFYLGALIAGMSDRVVARNGVAPVLFAAALLTKETAWTLPFALLLVDRLRNFLRQQDSWRHLLREESLREGNLHGEDLQGKRLSRGGSWGKSFQRSQALWMAMLAGGAIIVAIPAYRRMLVHIFSIRSPLDNMALQVDGWWYLLTRPLLLQTNIDPDLSSIPSFDLAWWMRAGLLVFSTIAALRVRHRWLQFALLWFFLHLLPTNSLLPRNDVANDRQLYLALIGPALFLAHSLAAIPLRAIRIGLVVVLLGVCGAATWQRNGDYRDEIALWEATARSSPHKARVWNNLGYAYQLAGRHDAAIDAYAQALSIDSNHERARINLRLLREERVQDQ